MVLSPMRPEPTAKARADAEDVAGHWESAGAAIAFSSSLGMIHLALQLMQIAPSDTFIGPGALALISTGSLALGAGMIWQARRIETRNSKPR